VQAVNRWSKIKYIVFILFYRIVVDNTNTNTNTKLLILILLLMQILDKVMSAAADFYAPIIFDDVV